MTTTYESVLVDIADRVAVVTINRPEVRNAVNAQAQADLRPMGPFELMDLTGIGIGYHVKQARYAETGDPADAPSRNVVELVEGGRLGRTTGLGWYSYDSGAKAVVVQRPRGRADHARDHAHQEVHQEEGPCR